MPDFLIIAADAKGTGKTKKAGIVPAKGNQAEWRFACFNVELAEQQELAAPFE